ncbi:hypothetical protein ACPC54_01400 [Kitasatospora sp. NPDC094028]
MAIARKGTRGIVVDGVRYRWVVSPGGEAGVGVVVLGEDGDGQRVVAWFEHGVVVTPGLVAGVVREALLRHGWTPRARGRRLTLRCPGGSPDPARPGLVPWPPTA